jgi:RNA polymerase sigma-70 factor (ECF subfamily)
MMSRSLDALAVQHAIRRPWRRYLDRLEEHRPALHAYCRQLTGNVWDGEDLVQDTLLRVFNLLAKTDTRLKNPKAYLIRAATNLWIDRVRRSAREQAAMAPDGPDVTSEPLEPADNQPAAKALFQMLHPQERTAILMKDVFDLSLDETAALLHRTIGAVKSALSRARARLEGRRPVAGFDVPPKPLVERFMRALSAKDMEVMKSLCTEHIAGELVGGAKFHSFDQARKIFEHAHMVMPKIGFGERPWWKVSEYEGEPIVLGFRTLDGAEGLNELQRIEALDGKIVRVRIYCFCPETLAVVAETLGCKALPRPHRSPTLADFVSAMLGDKAALAERA